MITKEVLLNQLAACLDEPNWFVPLTAAVHGLTAKQATIKSGTANSIWQIVNHLTFWNDRYLKRFKEQPLEEGHITNDETFNSSAPANEEEWQSAVASLQDVLSEWRIALDACDDDKLLASAYQDRTEPWSSVIGNITIHNAYHIGQIVEIRKKNGIWDAQNGVH